MIAAPTRFVGGEALSDMLAPIGLTLADWNRLAAQGEVPPATYAYPQIAKWRRSDVAAFVALNTHHQSENEPVYDARRY